MELSRLRQLHVSNGARLIGVCLTMLGLLLVQSRVQASELQQVMYDGTLGTQRIGMILGVDGQHIGPGRYYYYRHLTDIPLSGESEGGVLTLHESGATFTLHFVGNGSEHGQPLSFESSVGLEGTWSNGKSTLPVKLQMSGVTAATPTGHWYQLITDETDDVFEARTKGFYAAVLKGDSTQAARYVHFPLRVNSGAGKHEQIRNAQQLVAEWTRLITPAYVAKLRDTSPHAMPVVQGYAMLGNGLAFFSDKGVDVLNVP